MQKNCKKNAKKINSRIETLYIHIRAKTIQNNPSRSGIEFVLDEIMFDVLQSWIVIDGVRTISDSLNAP